MGYLSYETIKRGNKKMPLLDFSDARWEWDENRKRYYRVGIFNGLQYKNSLNYQLKAKKSRNQFDCISCGKTRGKGTRYVGENYSRICFYCLNDWNNNSINKLKQIIGIIKENQKDLKKNEPKWNKEALVGALTIADDSVK